MSLAFGVLSILGAKGAEKKDVDNSPKVIGIGGIFFLSEEPAKVTQWYVDNLGLKTDEYGGVFDFNLGADSSKFNEMRWNAFAKTSKYLEPSKSNFMINYKVRNIEGIIEKMKANGAQIVDEMETYDFGKFIHVLDSDGNKIELWEPNYDAEKKKDWETK
jgi:predicted enzyme related to lactoylglutathione lyase